jgi:KaiC/GvpD/RAD55 family RecA-like ATPase
MVKGITIKVEEPQPTQEEGEELQRLPIGIEALDKAMEGGIPLGSWVVITGEPGTGKTVLTQHAVKSAVSNGFRVIVVSTEMRLWEWRQQAKELGLLPDIKIHKFNDIFDINWSTGKVVIKNRDARIVFIDVYNLSQVAKLLRAQEKQEKSTPRWYSYLDSQVLSSALDVVINEVFSEKVGDKYRLNSRVLLVIDSISMFYVKAPTLAAKVALDLSLRLKNPKTVALLTAQYAQTTKSTFGFRVEHIADGVIHMWMDPVEKYKEVRRYLIIKKMRATNHSLRAFRIDIQPRKGIVVTEE